MATRGSYVHNSMPEFSAESRKFYFYAIFSENWWFQTKIFTGLLELIQLYKQRPLEFFSFTIYQNYTLALSTKKEYFPLYRRYSMSEASYWIPKMTRTSIA